MTTPASDSTPSTLKTASVTIDGEPRAFTFDAGEMSPRLRRQIEDGHSDPARVGEDAAARFVEGVLRTVATDAARGEIDWLAPASLFAVFDAIKRDLAAAGPLSVEIPPMLTPGEMRLPALPVRKRHRAVTSRRHNTNDLTTT